MNHSYYNGILRRMLANYVDAHGEPVLCYTHNSRNLELDFNAEIENMPNNSMRVFTEIPVGQIPHTVDISQLDIALTLQRLISARHVYGLLPSGIAHQASAVKLVYDFLFVIKDKNGNIRFYAIEVNGEHHYIGNTPKFYNQLKNDAAKATASKLMGINLKEFNVMHGFEPSDYMYVESLLRKGKAKLEK